MRPEEDRSFASPEVINPDDPADLRAWANELKAALEDIVEAVEAVGPNRTAVELWLAAPPA